MNVAIVVGQGMLAQMVLLEFEDLLRFFVVEHEMIIPIKAVNYFGFFRPFVYHVREVCFRELCVPWTLGVSADGDIL